MKSLLKRLLSSDVTPGVLLLITTVIAVAIENSDCCTTYKTLSPSITHWVNDGLMVIFFLLVGLEIKREFVHGSLQTKEQRLLPIIGAVGGMLVPATVYLYFAGSHPEYIRGWAIASATDIAFALGILSLLGSRVNPALRIFLTALAIIDDLGAILIIALFYSSSISITMLLGAAACFALLLICNTKGIRSLFIYCVLGVALWLFVLNSGIHATIAGVLLALTIPINKLASEKDTPLEKLEHAIKPWVNFLIMPIFALFNAGVSIVGINFETLSTPITSGVAFGLFCGKQIGVFLFCAVAILLKKASLPKGTSFNQFYGVAILTGIGFTMSLFISGLAFVDQEQTIQSRIGIITGSLLSAVVGLAWLALSLPTNKQHQHDNGCCKE